MSIAKKIFYASLAIAGIGVIAYAVSKIMGRDPETMTVDELTQAMNDFAAEDTRSGYMKAAYIRDVIARKQKQLSVAA